MCKDKKLIEIKTSKEEINMRNFIKAVLREIVSKISFGRILPALLSFLLLFGNAYGQSVSEIKNQRDKYIWGEGTGATLTEANKNALSNLVGQISTHVESKFKQIEEQVEENGDIEYSQKVNSVVNTYSEATLHNTERIVISNEPDAKVFRYIRRENVEKVFENRKDKIMDFVENARKAVKQRRIGDGLRYYYWAFTLLKSHPDCNEIKYTDKNGEKHPLLSWIPMQMNKVFPNIDFQVKKVKNKKKSKTVILHISYKGDPVVNLDYSYWSGQDWSNLFNVKDGRGVLKYYGAASEGKEKGKVKVEYIYETKANYDKELKRVMDKIDPVPFKKSYADISFKKKKTPDTLNAEVQNTESNISRMEDPSEYRAILEKVKKAIRDKQYDAAKNRFTERGYKMYRKLITYGKAELLPKADYSCFKFRDGVMMRSLPMSFSFQNSIQDFVEDVVFHFNQEKKIESISFGLSKNAFESIFNMDEWNKTDRMVLINFLEHYKTAYALERLDYIESVFSEDALIITGYVVKIDKSLENQYEDNRIVKYNRHTKQEYIQHLRDCFQSKEFINIQFEESEIRKGGEGGDIYGVQIKQNYFSSNYGDKGYLFLMVDLNEPGKPVIHVRTWQPTKADSTYDLSNF